MPTILSREVGPIGYGLMSHTLGPPASLPSEDQAFEALRTAADLGCLLWNGGETYGPPTNNSLVLLNRFFTKYPEYADKVIINIKGCLKPNWQPDCSPEFIRQSVENCVKQLGGKARIHMFACARKDPEIPFDQQLNTLKELLDQGKIDSVALSEVNANTIREATKILKISAVEIELSLWSTEPLKNGILKTCADLDIPVIAYCPLGRAMLTGELTSAADLPAHDLRRMIPRYQDGNFEENMKLVRAVEGLAKRKGCTTGQIALGWLVALSKRPGMPTIIPIPGTKSVEHVRENGTLIKLTEEEMMEVDSIIETHAVAGDRYHAFGMKLTDL